MVNDSDMTISPTHLVADLPKDKGGEAIMKSRTLMDKRRRSFNQSNPLDIPFSEEYKEKPGLHTHSLTVWDYSRRSPQARVCLQIH